ERHAGPDRRSADQSVGGRDARDGACARPAHRRRDGLGACADRGRPAADRFGVAPRPGPPALALDWAATSATLQFLASRCLGIAGRGRAQGLMMVKIAGCACRLPPDAGQPLVYVDYLEVTPWNLRALTQTPRFGGIGVRLIEAAVRLSIGEGSHGRVGLHSL